MDELNDEPEFLKRFGLDRYTAALQETHAEIALFLENKDAADMLSDADREEAHRLSGSAAVLGKLHLWNALQDLQNALEDHWGAHLAHVTHAAENAFSDLKQISND